MMQLTDIITIDNDTMRQSWADARINHQDYGEHLSTQSECDVIMQRCSSQCKIYFWNIFQEWHLYLRFFSVNLNKCDPYVHINSFAKRELWGQGGPPSPVQECARSAGAQYPCLLLRRLDISVIIIYSTPQSHRGLCNCCNLTVDILLTFTSIVSRVGPV